MHVLHPPPAKVKTNLILSLSRLAKNNVCIVIYIKSSRAMTAKLISGISQTAYVLDVPKAFSIAKSRNTNMNKNKIRTIGGIRGGFQKIIS